MVLVPFSIPEHVELLLSGAKRQTTRQPRKKPLKVGDILHCYYQPRQKKTCGNCIVQGCEEKSKVLIDDGKHRLRYSCCYKHNNFFGKAKATGILHLCPGEYSGTPLTYDIWAQPGERWLGGFGNHSEAFMEAWARADGFENLQAAHKWFSKSTGNDQWMFLPWDVIIFEPDWIIPTIEEVSRNSGIPIWNPED